MRDVLQRCPHRDEGRAVFIQKPHARGGCRAAAAIVGGAAAQCQHDTPCAVAGRVADQLPYAVSGGALRVSALPHQGQPRRRGHFHHRRTVGQQAVLGRQGLTVRAVAGHAHPLTTHRRQERIHRALAAVRHRDGAYLRIRLLGADLLRHDAADLQRGQRPLEGVRDQHILAHKRSSLRKRHGMASPCRAYLSAPQELHSQNHQRAGGDEHARQQHGRLQRAAHGRPPLLVRVLGRSLPGAILRRGLRAAGLLLLSPRKPGKQHGRRLDAAHIGDGTSIIVLIRPLFGHHLSYRWHATK